MFVLSPEALAYIKKKGNDLTVWLEYHHSSGG